MKYAGKTWDNIVLEFAIEFVGGDTELHEKLCGKYSIRMNMQEFQLLKLGESKSIVPI